MAIVNTRHYYSIHDTVLTQDIIVAFMAIVNTRRYCSIHDTVWTQDIIVVFMAQCEHKTLL